MILNSTAFSALLVVVIIGILIFRQIHPRRLSGRGLVVVPLIILYFLIKAWPELHPSMANIVEVGISSIVSLVLGVLACQQLRVYPSPDTGKAMTKGSWTYFLWWLAAFVIKGCLAVAFGETSFSSVNQVEILIPVFLLVTTRNAYLYWKVTELGLDLHGKRD
jgi:hypothetical protein